MRSRPTDPAIPAALIYYPLTIIPNPILFDNVFVQRARIWQLYFDIVGRTQVFKISLYREELRRPQNILFKEQYFLQVLVILLCFFNPVDFQLKVFSLGMLLLLLLKFLYSLLGY